MWIALARALVTRTEVKQMIQDRMEALATANARQEQLIDAMRGELVALRGEVIRLGVLLGVGGARDPAAPTGMDKAKGN